jgi:hypothetical protein
VWAFVVFRGGSGTARADRRWASRVKLRGAGPWNRVAEVTRLRADGSCTTGLPQRPSGVCAPSLAPGPRGRGLIVVHGSGAGAKIGERIGWLESVMRAGL